MAIPTFGEFISGSQQPSSKPGKKTPSFAEFLGSQPQTKKEDGLDKAVKVANVVGDFLGGKVIGEAIGTGVAKKKTLRGDDIVLPDYSKLTAAQKEKLKSQGVPTSREEQLAETAASIKGPTKAQIAGDVAKIGLNFLPYGKIAGKVGGATLGSATKLTPSAVRAAKITGEVATGVAGGAAIGAASGVAAGKEGKDVLKDTLVGAATGGILPVAFSGIGRLFAKKPVTSLSQGYVTKAEQAATRATEEAASRTTPEVGKDIRTIMEELSDAGFNKDQITKTMDNLYGSRPDAKRFTDDEITREAIKVQPDYYKPYTPPDQLPTIGFDAKTKSTKTFKEFLETPKVADIPEQIPTTQPIRKNVYEFNENQFKKAEDFVKKVDPEFESGSMPKYKESFSKLSRQDLVDISTGVKKAPEDIPATVVKALTKELPDLTKTERNRLAKSTFVQSKAGSELAGAKYLTDEVINDPYVYAGRKQKELVDKALKKGYTKKTITRFLDDLEC